MTPAITQRRIPHIGDVWDISDGELTLMACLDPVRGLKSWQRIKRGEIAGTNVVDGGRLITSEPASEYE